MHTFSENDESYGWSKFAKTAFVHDPEYGFVEDGWLTFTAYVLIVGLDEQQPTRVSKPASSNHKPASASQTLPKSETEGKCVICLTNEQTSGFVHGDRRVSAALRPPTC